MTVPWEISRRRKSFRTNNEPAATQHFISCHLWARALLLAVVFGPNNIRRILFRDRLHLLSEGFFLVIRVVPWLKNTCHLSFGLLVRLWVLYIWGCFWLGTLVFAFIEVLEDVSFLIRRVVSNILLHSLDLLNEVKLVLLGQVVQVQFYLFLSNALFFTHRVVIWSLCGWLTSLFILIRTQLSSIWLAGCLDTLSDASNNVKQVQSAIFRN